VLQLLGFRPKTLDHSMQVKNDLNQFFAAERFQMFQDPGSSFHPQDPGLLNRVTHFFGR